MSLPPRPTTTRVRKMRAARNEPTVSISARSDEEAKMESIHNWKMVMYGT